MRTIVSVINALTLILQSIQYNKQTKFESNFEPNAWSEHYRVMSKRFFNKICGVCCGKARGRNFGAITCESCKAFFRRSMARTNDLKCNYENNCLIDEMSRVYCQKCRLDRCFEIGMRRELVVNKVNNTKKKRSNVSQTSFASSSDDTDSYSMSDAIPDLFYDLMSQLFSQSDQSVTVQIDNKPSVDRTASVVPVLNPISTYDKPWNDFELNRLTELNSAANVFHFGRSDQTSACVPVFNLADLYIKLSSFRVYDSFIMSSIKFCKSLDLFREVCEDDRVTLFRSNSYKLLFLKHRSTWARDGLSWNYILDDGHSLRFDMSPFSIFNESQQIQEYCAGYRQCVNLQKHEWFDDTTLVNLMMAILIFYDDIPDLAHSHIVRLDQQMYFYLLQRHFIQKFVDNSSELSHLMRYLDQVHKWFTGGIKCPPDYRPLLTPFVREIFDV